MAGYYADVPGVRIPYHVDGSLVRWANTVSNSNKVISGSWTDFSSVDIGKMNKGTLTDDVSIALGAAAGKYLAWVFPQPISVLAGHNVLINPVGGAPTVGLLEYSLNTIDGADGTWTTFPSDNQSSNNPPAVLRDISAVNVANVKGLRLHLSNTSATNTMIIRDIGFYGAWTPATLAGWHPTLDQQIPAAHLDYGDIAIGAVVTKQFRIKNGRSLQANNITVSAPIGNPITMAGLLFSLDGSTFLTSVIVSSLAAEAISPLIHVRRTVGIAESSGTVGIAPIQFVAASWT